MNTITHHNQDYEIIPIQDAIIQSKLLEGSYLMRPVATAPKIYRADRFKAYYRVDDCLHGDFNVDIKTDNFYKSDSNRHNSGNYFKTEEQAQSVVDVIKLVFKYVQDNQDSLKWIDISEALMVARQKVQEDQ